MIAQKIIALIITTVVLVGFLSYCFAEETPATRRLNPEKTRETFNLIVWIIILFGLIIALIERISNRRSRNYSCFGDDFGGDFKQSSGGIYYGDGFKGIKGTFLRSYKSHRKR